MRLKAALALAAGAVVLALLWRSGALAALTAEAFALQKAMQDGLARSVLAIRRGEPGALAALVAAAGLYGVAHAAGPGHGKALLGAAAVASRAWAGRIAGLALVSALAQGLTAVVLVYGALALLGAPASSAVGLGERGFEPFAWGAVAVIGLWFAARGARGVLAAAPGGQAVAHAHAADEACGCGHAHGPTAAEVAALRDWRDAAALVGAVALRPCAGAMMTLAVAWGVGVPVAGLLAVLAMSLGVALVTGGVALGAMGARDTALAAAGAARLAPVAAGLQAAAGVAVFAMGAAGLAASL
jgi:ABC-type nickel/cobalt efflux system permease component RcnA